MKNNCRNTLCVYQVDDYCTLDRLEIDEMGCCTACITVMIPEEELGRRKKELLQRLDKGNQPLQSAW